MTSTTAEPDNTAVRTALWRALHLQVDAEPAIIRDQWGLKLVAPSSDWTERPDMKFTKRLRAAIVARARFIEDVVMKQVQQGINQYLILGAGLDTFAQRHPHIARGLSLFEIDQPGTLNWKQNRLKVLGYDLPEYFHFVPVDFENTSWWEALLKAGFDNSKPVVVTCAGVLLYLTQEAIVEMLNTFKKLATGSLVVLTFNLPMTSVADEDKPLIEIALKGARAAGTPMISFFNPEDIAGLAEKIGFREVKTTSTDDIKQLYFRGRTDDLIPASGEEYLILKT